MATIKKIDSEALDTALEYTADKIREKTGSNADILFDMANGIGFGDAIDEINSIPSYLNHISITPEEDVNSISIPVGINTMKKLIFIANLSYNTTPAVTTVISGTIILNSSNAILTTSCVFYRSGNSISRLANNGNGAANSYDSTNGILTIGCSNNNYYFPAGIQYDFFWYT